MAESLNPYIAGNPITGSEMFFGRDDVFAFIHQALTGKHQDNVLVLYGQRRTGKTSVLYQMRHHLEDRYLPIFIDLHGLALESLSGFILELANIISRGLRRGYGVELPPLDRAEFTADARNAFETTFLEGIWERIGDRQLLLMLDEAIRLEEQVRAGKLDPDIFDYLRHLMQHHPRLNFLFSLGSGLEEMEKEYAFLFNVALYKKISFLDRGSAVDLITRPVENIYRLDQDAIERILEVTSAHPYFTQLICHGLFNHCTSNKITTVTVSEVNGVLDEAVERGLAVLKHVWEESSPAEKAVLSGLAALSASAAPADEAAILKAWAGLGEVIPRGEIASAVKRLISRDVIVDSARGGYQFTVELQRMWVMKYRRLDWTQEEIKAWLVSLPKEQPPLPEAQPPALPWYRRPVNLLSLIVLFGIVLLAAILFSPVKNFVSNRPISSPSETAPSGSNEFPQDAAKVSTMVSLGGYMWAGTDGGLVRWDKDGNYIIYDYDQISLDCINALLADSENTLWIGCGGVSRVKPDGDDITEMDYYDRDSGLATGNVRAFALDPNGEVWAGGHADPGGSPLSRFGGWSWVDSGPLMDALKNLGKSWSSIRSMMWDDQGQGWLGFEDVTVGGILRWDGENNEYYFYSPEGQTGDDRRVQSIAQNRTGGIWIAAHDMGLLLLDPQKGEIYNWDLPGYNGPVSVVTMLSDGSLWAGGDRYIAKSEDNGLTWEKVGSSEGLGEEILAIVEDDSGNVWAGAYNQGVSVLEDNTWKPLP